MEKEKAIEEMKERMLKGFLAALEEIAFVKSTDSISGEEVELNPIIEDMEAVIKINAEFDREDLKRLIISRAG